MCSFTEILEAVENILAYYIIQMFCYFASFSEDNLRFCILLIVEMRTGFCRCVPVNVCTVADHWQELLCA